MPEQVLAVSKSGSMIMKDVSASFAYVSGANREMFVERVQGCSSLLLECWLDPEWLERQLLEDSTILWCYRSPARSCASSEGAEWIRDLRAWARLNQKAINLGLHERLKFVNIDRADLRLSVSEGVEVAFSKADSAEVPVSTDPEEREVWEWVHAYVPLAREVYEILELAAIAPLGDAAPTLGCPSGLLIGDGDMQVEGRHAEGMKRHNRKLIELSEVLTARDRELDDLQQRLHSAQEELEGYVAAGLEKRLEGVKRQLASTQADLGNANRECEDLRSQVRSLELELAAARHEMIAATKEGSEAARSLAQTRAALAALESRTNTQQQQFQQKLSSLEAELGRAKQELAAAELACNKGNGKNRELALEVNDLTRRLHEVNKELQSLAQNAVERVALPGSQRVWSPRGVLDRVGPFRRKKISELARQERGRLLNLIRGSDLFDAKWYIQAYPDVGEAHMDPAEHFLDFGWKEHRNPSRAFNTAYYLMNNLDVAKSAINPLVHFIEWGRAEGRSPNPSMDELDLIAS